MDAELSAPALENVTRTELLTKKKKPYEVLSDYKGQEGFFMKAFFIDDTFNSNDWRVTQEAINRDMKTAIEHRFPGGKTSPFILRDDLDHPDVNAPGSMMSKQEPFRAGDTIEAGVQKNGVAYAVYRIDDKDAIDRIQNGDINFVSPSIHAEQERHLPNGKVEITRFTINHSAGVRSPAYGNFKAQIVGRCAGAAKTCLRTLLDVQAETVQAVARIVYNTQGDSKVDARICKALEGAVFNSGNENRLLIPDDTHPNCRCFWTLQSTGENLGQDPIAKNLQAALNNEKSKKNDKQAKSLTDEPKFMDGIKIAQCENTGNLVIELQAQSKLQECVSGILSEKLTKGEKPTDQDLAIAFSECRDRMGKSESLKTNTSKKKSLTAQEEEEKKKQEEARHKAAQEEDEKKKVEEARRAQEEEDKKKKEENGKIADEETIKELKKEQEEMRAQFDDEVKKPLQEKVAQQRVELEFIKADEKQAEIKKLEDKSIPALKELHFTYEAVLKKLEGQAQKIPRDIRYETPYQASGKKTEDPAFMKTNWGKMGQ